MICKYGNEADFLQSKSNKGYAGHYNHYDRYVIDPSRTFRRCRLFAHTVRIYMILEYFLYILVCVENIQTSYEEMVVSKMKLAAGSIEKKEP